MVKRAVVHRLVHRRRQHTRPRKPRPEVVRINFLGTQRLRVGGQGHIQPLDVHLPLNELAPSAAVFGEPLQLRECGSEGCRKVAGLLEHRAHFVGRALGKRAANHTEAELLASVGDNVQAAGLGKQQLVLSHSRVEGLQLVPPVHLRQIRRVHQHRLGPLRHLFEEEILLKCVAHPRQHQQNRVTIGHVNSAVEHDPLLSKRPARNESVLRTLLGGAQRLHRSQVQSGVRHTSTRRIPFRYKPTAESMKRRCRGKGRESLELSPHDRVWVFPARHLDRIQQLGQSQRLRHTASGFTSFFWLTGLRSGLGFFFLFAGLIGSLFFFGSARSSRLDLFLLPLLGLLLFLCSLRASLLSLCLRPQFFSLRLLRLAFRVIHSCG
mmetsp:Transcript_70152/g.186919  ORF Transcript_70152/g.186919 Transcript_70152/m.186919 type:complete len:379 (-) Transcript_70152:1542-2678(-)